jgi:hypothetical protein
LWDARFFLFWGVQYWNPLLGGAMLRLLPSFVLALAVGCSSSNSSAEPLTPEETAKAKVEMLRKVLETAENTDTEGKIRVAFEKYRDVPFDPKAHPEEAKSVIDHLQKLRGKVKGEMLVEIDGELKLMQEKMK